MYKKLYIKIKNKIIKMTAKLNELQLIYVLIMKLICTETAICTSLKNIK